MAKIGIKNLVERCFCQSCERLLPEGNTFGQEHNYIPGRGDYLFTYCPYCGEKLDWELIGKKYTEYWDRLDRENFNDEYSWWWYRPMSRADWEKNPQGVDFWGTPNPRWKRAGKGNREYGIKFS